MSVAGSLDSSLSPASPPDGARREQFAQTFEEHFRAVSAYALRRTTPAEAEDAVGETFLVAWRRIDELPEEPKPWLLGIARRVLANQRRAAGRRHALTERVAGFAAGEQERSRRPAVLQALAALSALDREVLLVVAWDGLSIEEAATVLRCSRTALKVRLHRARHRLRVELERLERGRTDGLAMTRRLEECHEER
jgi:RNA polymerase sigma-70 factor (ECF subfamily)